MLRVFLLSSAFIVWSSLLFAQKRDNVWMLGSYSNFQNFGLDFNSGSADTFSLIRRLNFSFSNSSICDTTGALLFYTNGITIMNRNHDTLLNADNFNPGFFTDYYADFGIAIHNATVIIPKPDSEQTKFFIFHESAETLSTVTSANPLNLSYSEIDLNLDAGLGGIITGKKNIHIIDDTLMLGRLSAVKHGNGRDWWIMSHRFNSPIHYRFLVTPDSIYGPYSQSIGSINPPYSFAGQSIFSNDGSQYAIQTDDTTVDVYDFDRCDGLLSNVRTIEIVDSNLAIVGCAFSPSGHYLYINNGIFIHQFDTWNANIWSSDQVVAQWDTFNSPGPTTFQVLKLAPDKIIYLCTYTGTNIFHYIENPDSGGLACSVVQNSFLTPGFGTHSFPNSPNWDLGPSSGSICDSLFNNVGSNNADDLEFKIYPNPAQNNFLVKASSKIFKGTTFTLFNNLGEEKIKSTLNSSIQKYEFDSGNLNDGIYFYLIRTPEKILQSGKLIIAK